MENPTQSTPQPVASQTAPLPAPPNFDQKQKNNTILYIVIGFMFLLIIILFGYIILNQRQSKEPTPEQVVQNQQNTPFPEKNIAASPPSENPQVSTDSAQTAIPEGYMQKETLCYSYVYPDTFEANEDNDCYQYIRSLDQKFIASINIDPLYEISSQKQDSADDLVLNRTPKYTILESEDLVVDGKPARKILEKDQNSPINMHNIRVFVYSPSPARKIKGFEIIMRYSDDDSAQEVQMKKDILAAVLNSMKWK